MNWTAGTAGGLREHRVSRQHLSRTLPASTSLRPPGAGLSLGHSSLQPDRAVATVGLKKDSKASQCPHKQNSWQTRQPRYPRPGPALGPFPVSRGLRKSRPPTAHVRRPGRRPPPEASAVHRAPHSLRAASGSSMVTELWLPAFGILKRFHGSRPGSPVAILGGRGGAGKGGAGRDLKKRPREGRREEIWGGRGQGVGLGRGPEVGAGLCRIMD